LIRKAVIQSTAPAFQPAVVRGTIYKMNGATPIVWLSATPIIGILTGLFCLRAGAIEIKLLDKSPQVSA